MKIKIIQKERMTLDDFSEKHDLTMIVKERSKSDLCNRWAKLPKYYASFENSEISEGNFLLGLFGNGGTPEEAIADYKNKISEKLLVICSCDIGKRREIRVPILIDEA